MLISKDYQQMLNSKGIPLDGLVVMSPNVDTVLLLALPPISMKVRRVPTELGRRKRDVFEFIPRFGRRHS
jgi:hypothetical protein